MSGPYPVPQDFNLLDDGRIMASEAATVPRSPFFFPFRVCVWERRERLR